MFKQEIIKMLEKLPEEELINVYWAVKHIENRYNYNWNLFGKGIEITNLFEESEEIIALWDHHFAGNICEAIRTAIHYDQYKWHIFSYNQQDCLSEDGAKSAFNAIHKKEVYVMYQRSPYITLLSNAKELTAEDFDTEQDVYIFDSSYTWTYVKTHESLCGPYFLQM